ncbi:MAG: cupin domain-containing protein [Vulcanimicrobiaceae bacterium]
MNDDVEHLIVDLQLLPHPEGGYYRETYRSANVVVTSDGSQRCALTNIYFLLPGETFSAWHRIDADEAWHFYCGTGLVILIIDQDGRRDECRFAPTGPWQTTIAAGKYFAAYVPDPKGYALVGCSVAPGFDFSGFELPSREELTARFPQHSEIIRRFTREAHDS